MNRSQHSVFRFILLAVVACAVLCGCRRNDAKSSKPSTSDASQSIHGYEDVIETNLNSIDATLPHIKSDWSTLDSAAGDGWTSEAVADRVLAELNKLGVAVAANHEERANVAEAIATKSFTASDLVPDSPQYEYDSPPFEVVRWHRGTNEPQGDVPNTSSDTTFTSGPSRLAEVLGDLGAEWRSADLPQFRYKFKVVRIQSEEGAGCTTDQYVSLYGTTEEKSIEQNATWRIRWIRSTTGELKMDSLTLESFEQTTGPRPFFSDVTANALAANGHMRDQLLRGMNHWLLRNHDTRYFSPLGNPGLAIGDVNGDGRDDLFLCQETGLPNRLFIQQPDGTALDASAKWNVDWLNGCRSANLIDLDNDGDEDIAVTVLGGVVVAENTGGRFVVRDVLSTDDDTMSINSVDYDRDGDLDIYVCVGYPNDVFADGKIAAQGAAANRVYHDARGAGKNSLFRNDSKNGEWSFIDVTMNVGLGENNDRFSFASSWDDFDNDGDPDLYVANDFGSNSLYENSAGVFKEIAEKANAEDRASGMSVAWGDIDRDGHTDLYIGNMFSSAGARITSQSKFKPKNDVVRKRIQRFARGSTLLANNGDGTFSDISVSSATTLGRWAWSSNFADINNDGWEDILVANGYITAESSGDL